MRENPSIENQDYIGNLEDRLAFETGSRDVNGEHEVSLDNIDAKFEEVAYPGHANVGNNIIDLRVYPERDFSKRPDESWGTGVNDTHCINYHKFVQPGVNDDGNTAYFETEDVSFMIGDVEFLSGSSENGYPRFDYTAESTFKNKKVLKTSEAVQERPLGTTLQFKPSSDTETYGKLLDSDYRIPQNHITAFGGNSHHLLGRTYEGYQHRGADDGGTWATGSKGMSLSSGAPIGSKGADKELLNVGQGNTSKLPYEDLSNRAFYRVEIDNKGGRGKLKIIRNDETEGTL